MENNDTIDRSNLLTIREYAEAHWKSVQYIGKLIKEKLLEAVEIDKVRFIDKTKFPELPVRPRGFMIKEFDEERKTPGKLMSEWIKNKEKREKERLDHQAKLREDY